MSEGILPITDERKLEWKAPATASTETEAELTQDLIAGQTGDELQATQPDLTDQQRTEAEAVLTGKTFIESQLNAINDPAQTLPTIRKYLADGGNLDDVRSSYASSITEAESGKKSYRADIAAALEIETQRIQNIETMSGKIGTAESAETVEALLTTYGEQYPDCKVEDIIPEGLSEEQRAKVESAQRAIKEKQHEREKATWVEAINTFVSDKDKAFLANTAELMNAPQVQEMLTQLNIPEADLKEVQDLLLKKAGEEVVFIEAEEKSEKKLRHLQLAALGIMFVLDPWKREEMMIDFLKNKTLAPALKKLGLTEEQVRGMLGNFSPGAEIARLPFRQFEPAFQKLGNREVFQMLRNMPKGERIAFVKEHKYEGRELGGDSKRKIGEFMSWLSPNYQKELGIYSSPETKAA